MAKQMKLTNAQFRSFVDCPLEEKDYVAILVQKGYLTQPSQKPDES